MTSKVRERTSAAAPFTTTLPHCLSLRRRQRHPPFRPRLCTAGQVAGEGGVVEERGYVERLVLPTDRRVKLVHITALGEEAKARALACLHEPPPA